MENYVAYLKANKILGSDFIFANKSSGDWARDNLHYGNKTHEKFANLILDKIHDKYVNVTPILSTGTV